MVRGFEIINRLKELDLSTYPVDKIRSLLSDMAGALFMNVQIPPKKLILRGRPNAFRKRYYSKMDMQYKPQHLNTTYQRASTPEKTMFYGVIIPQGQSGDDYEWRLVALWECLKTLRDRPGKFHQKITFSKWCVKEMLNVVAICHRDQVRESHPFFKELSDASKKIIAANDSMREDSIAFSTFLSAEFSKEVGESNDYEYLISSLFTEAVNKMGFDGVLYPSPKIPGGYNIATTPEVTDTKMEWLLSGECTLYKNGSQIALSNDTLGIVRDQRLPVDYSKAPAADRLTEVECLRTVGIKNISELPYGVPLYHWPSTPLTHRNG